MQQSPVRETTTKGKGVWCPCRLINIPATVKPPTGPVANRAAIVAWVSADGSGPNLARERGLLVELRIIAGSNRGRLRHRQSDGVGVYAGLSQQRVGAVDNVGAGKESCSTAVSSGGARGFFQRIVVDRMIRQNGAGIIHRACGADPCQYQRRGERQHLFFPHG